MDRPSGQSQPQSIVPRRPVTQTTRYVIFCCATWITNVSYKFGYVEARRYVPNGNYWSYRSSVLEICRQVSHITHNRASEPPKGFVCTPTHCSKAFDWKFPPFHILNPSRWNEPSCRSYHKSLVKRRKVLPSFRMKTLGHSCRPSFSEWRKGSPSVGGWRSWHALQPMTTCLIMMVVPKVTTVRLVILQWYLLTVETFLWAQWRLELA